MFKSKKSIAFLFVFLFIVTVASVTSFILASKTESKVNNSKLNIAYSTDKNYIYPTLVSMTSLMENADKDTFCKFTVLLSDGISEEDKAKLKTVENKYSNCSVNLVDMGQSFGNSELRWWSTAMYYRLHLPEILKEEKRCIYLDGDTIVRKDLREMFNINMDNYYIAGVRDINEIINKNSTHYKTLGIPNLDTYVCSGVLIMNLAKMRNDDMMTKLDEAVAENDVKQVFKFPDQDALNKVCYNHILTLPMKYGALAHTAFGIPYEENEYAKWASNEKDWEEGRKDPTVVHFTCDKPWKNVYSELCEEWWKYANKTDFKSEIENRYHPKHEKTNY